MLTTIIFSFSHNIFDTFQKKNQFFSQICFLSSANAYNLDQSKIMLFGKELNTFLSIN